MDIKELIKKILESLKNKNELTFNDLDVDKDTFGEAVEMAQNDGLIIDANVQRAGRGNKVVFVILKNAKITLKGIEYLEKN